MPSPEVIASFRAMWLELASIGGSPSSGYRRFALTAEDDQLRTWFVRHCERLRLPVRVDRAGNQWAWWEPPASHPEGASPASHPEGALLSSAPRWGASACRGRKAGAPAPGVATGSHLDSVPDGGAFDGPLGVVSALAAVEQLQQAGFVPSVPLGVVNFADEEGARFKVACLGSRVLTGVLPPERALELSDDAGVSLADALRAAGRDAASLGPDPDALARVGTYVELHVEQGRHLVDVGAPLAVARDIWPHGRWRITLPGRADHAGTTRLADRADAMVSFAEAVLAARAKAAELGTVATIGKVQVLPGGVNAIPALATCWLDARGPLEAPVRATVAAVADVVARAGGTIAEESWTPPTPFDPDLRDQLSALLAAPVIGTGAGHDAGILANAGVRTAMLFVRNPTGTSHSPAEHADEADCLIGVDALTRVLAQLAGRGSR